MKRHIAALLTRIARRLDPPRQVGAANIAITGDTARAQEVIARAQRDYAQVSAAYPGRF